MKRLIYFFLLCALFSCGGPKHEISYQVDTAAIKPIELQYDTITKKIKEINAKLGSTIYDYKKIKLELSAYKKMGITAIPVAESIIKNSIEKLSKAEKDSTYYLYMDLFYELSNEMSTILETKYDGIIKKIEEKTKDPEVDNFTKCLEACGLELLTTEGTYYLDAKYDHFYQLFKGKVSVALDDFLKIRSKEMKEGYSEDAGLLISFEDLYKRVEIWEDFIDKYPQTSLTNEAKGYYTSYLSTFITGMDNSRLFDYESYKLLPEIQTLYEQIISKKDNRKCRKIVSDYYDKLKANDFRELNKIEDFLKEKGLSSMLGVQPETR